MTSIRYKAKPTRKQTPDISTQLHTTTSWHVNQSKHSQQLKIVYKKSTLEHFPFSQTIKVESRGIKIHNIMLQI